LEPKESQGKVAADLPAVSDAIHGLLDLQGGSPGAVILEEVDILSSGGEEEVVELRKEREQRNLTRRSKKMTAVVLTHLMMKRMKV
jgi:hypothetical protein